MMRDPETPRGDIEFAESIAKEILHYSGIGELYVRTVQRMFSGEHKSGGGPFTKKDDWTMFPPETSPEEKMDEYESRLLVLQNVSRDMGGMAAILAVSTRNTVLKLLENARKKEEGEADKSRNESEG